MTKRIYRPAFYTSPISLPEARSGSVYVSHRKLTGDTPIIGMRQAINRGVRPVRGKIEGTLLVHELGDDDHGCWMTDLPEELNQIGELLHHVTVMGDVLIGGLGLGILAKIVASSTFATCVDVIERDENVIKLCTDASAGYHVIHADVHDYLRDHGGEYDVYLLDTWQGTNESTWWGEVMPQRRAIRNKFGRTPQIHAWAEDIMLGQIVRSLSICKPHWMYKYLALPFSESEARAFVRNVGLPSWEKKYGAAVDAAIEEDKHIVAEWRAKRDEAKQQTA